MTTLLHERGTLGVRARRARSRCRCASSSRWPRDRGATPVQRDAIAREWIELQALRVTAYRSLSALERTGHPRARRVDPQAAVVGGEPARDEARARAARPGRAAARRRTRPTAATGNTSSSAAAATRSRPARRRSSATSSPSACSACRGRADGPLVHAAPGRAPRAGALVPRGDGGADMAAARRARLDRRLGARGAGRRGARLPRGGRPARGVGRALLHAPLWSTCRRCCPPARRRPGGGREPARRAGRSRSDRSSPTSIRRPASRSSGETRSGSSTAPSGRCSTTNDETRPLGVVSGGGAGTRARSLGRAARASRAARSRASRSRRAASGRRALELASSYVARARAVRQARSAPTRRLAPARHELHASSSSPARSPLGRVVHRERRRRRRRSPQPRRRPTRAEAAVAACERAIQAHGGDRLHLGARPAPPLQARALDPVLGGVRRRSCGPRSRPSCSTEEDVRCRA